MDSSNEVQASALLTGQCLCGAVRYTVKDEFVYALNCHCSNCRRATGSAFKPFAGIECHKLTLTQGEAALLIYGDARAAHDVHCKHCGSLMYSVVRGGVHEAVHEAVHEGTFAHVTMGTLTDSPGIRPTAHIFVGSKAPWHTITDSLPQYQEFD
jgi:hypothetical protein